MEVPHALVPNTVESGAYQRAIFRDKRDRRSIRAIYALLLEHAQAASGNKVTMARNDQRDSDDHGEAPRLSVNGMPSMHQEGHAVH